jgi:hypothetical protein
VRRADSSNQRKLAEVFPDTWAELQARYNAPGGKLAADDYPRFGAVSLSDIQAHPTKRMDAEYWLNQEGAGNE